MPQFSALVATVLLVFSLLHLYLAHLGGAETREQIYALLESGYLIMLALSGWHYTVFKRTIWGIAHTVLMLGVAAFVGFVICFDKSDVAGGRGPDANPAGPILMLVRLIVGSVGIIALICGIGMGWRSLTARRNDPGNREPDS